MQSHISLQTLNLDEDVEAAVTESGALDLLGPFMIIFEDGWVIDCDDEDELGERLIQALNNGYGTGIAYIFCDGYCADFEYRTMGREVVGVTFIPRDIGDQIADADLDREMDRQMELAMDCDSTTGRGM